MPENKGPQIQNGDGVRVNLNAEAYNEAMVDRLGCYGEVVHVDTYLNVAVVQSANTRIIWDLSDLTRCE